MEEKLQMISLIAGIQKTKDKGHGFLLRGSFGKD
jgi:hypothetical protein